jgi:5-methylcytosine-specific restriction endonuclease McrA
MPIAPLRPCATCRRVGCTAHIRPAWGHARPIKRTFTGERLQRVREALYTAVGGKCPLCLRVCHIRDMERDHVINLADGGLDIPENCQFICKDCHKKKTEAEAKRGMSATS